jgi:hypothetical protein
MGLGTCGECESEVSVDAFSCPVCGAPRPADQKWNGWGYEWKSKAEIGGWPLVHVAVGLTKERKLRVAKGIIAIGLFGVGLVTIALVGVGLLFAMGMVVCGITAVGQIAVGALFGMGQITTGYVAIGQIAMGKYALGQVGVGEYVYSMARKDPEALEFFKRLWEWIKS